MLPPLLRLVPLREIPVTLRRGIPYAVGVPPQRVREVIGPQRINDGWFAGATVRDEYDLLLDDGILYRIYRQEQRWFMRGIYD